jgi:hypothetical protein
MSDLGDRIAELAEDVAKLEKRTEEAEGSAETYFMASQDDERLTREIKLLREFIADVRLGIRDLSEYDAICNPVYL